MGDFYGIKPGTVPGFAETSPGRFMGVQGLPEQTVQHMIGFMEALRGMHQVDPLAFEVCVRHVATVIEDQRREEGKADPREDPFP
ncbi:MAG TPA: hypothetical protein VF838_06520 [Trebonia sp.]